MRVIRKFIAFVLLPFAVLCLAAPNVVAQPRFRFDATPGRLSKDVVPLQVGLTLDLDPARDGFDGRAEIELRLGKPADVIELHAHELVASSAWLADGGKRRVLEVKPDPEAQIWRLVPADGRPLAAGRHRLTLVYAGQVQRQGSGLFRASAMIDGKPVPSLATQLEPIHARRVFPAFDEPVFRARYLLTVRAPAGLEVLANMPREHRSEAGGIATHRFAATPAMPSYLFAVAVGRYEVLEGRAAGVPLRIVTAPGKREQGRFALAATRQLLPYYTQYFGTPYALPRLDQLAVPSTRFGAMEDWGLISYAENGLLVDPATTSPAQQRRVFSLIAHEVAHQWFGNLVTAASWNEIWLNEAFATWMANKATDHFNPGWQTLLNNRGWVDETMALDATDATRAIRSGPVRETAVFDVFDGITYTKGGAVLTMVEQWLGEERFRLGLAAYMRERRMSNATAGDLWFHIGRAAGRDVAAMAASWTDQPGFPLVTVASRCEGGKTRVTLAQRRFRSAAAPAPAAEPQWQIPVRLARGAQAATVLLDQAQASTILAGCSDEPVRANAGGRGYYRVAYAPEAHAALRERFAALPPADRVALLADTLALAHAGALPLGEGLRWLALLPQVRDGGRVPLFKQAIEAFQQLDQAFAGTLQQAPLRDTARALLAAELMRLGWEPLPADDPETLAMRARLVRQLAAFDDAATLAEALARLGRDEAGTQPLHPSLREAVRIAAGVAADRARFDRMLAALAVAPGEQERRTLASALASGRDAGRARELLDRMLAGDLPSNIASMMPPMVAELSPHGELAYRHLLDHWPQWQQIAGQTGQRWLLPGTAENANDPARAQALIADQARLVGPDGARLAQRAAARIGQLADLKARAAGLGP
ncbi:Aminopeptidase [Rubrivivax sp. A210]|uniref:M1 family metallopeptidase n=1 Tax=Rubrivivax sp. A210 TaxID=2772301 RepID=UPI00191B6CD8|nr:M1 family metallopeptidase [Rubrivivax sp. A210]CAD5372734.1 Aminopeptidase [Rubrivivax sp. A210]